MKVLKYLLIVVLIVAAILFGGGFLLSPKFTVLRTVEINAPPSTVYPLVADPRAWQRWSVWNQRDPGMQMSFSGEPTGAGAGWAWASESQGNGRMAFTAAEPNEKIVFNLFFDDFDSVSTGTFLFEPTGNGTRVSWVMNGDMGRNPLMHWFALASDKMIGGDFEAGLANLKALAEKR